MNLLIIDNYDSFTYNLVHYIHEITGGKPDVYRNDKITLKAIDRYDMLMLSPGPGIPDESGILKEIIKTYAGKKPIFGVCLGLQAIVEVFGGVIVNMKKVFHGVATTMNITDSTDPIFEGVSTHFQAGRYHSWVAKKDTLPPELQITAEDENGQVMAIRHQKYPISAVQFHPESVLTPEGKKMIANFIAHYQTR